VHDTISPSAETAQDSNTLVADGLMTVLQAAKFLGLSRAKVYQLMDQGLLAYVKIGRSRRIPRRALVELAAQHLVRV
jgi:excisionase family DNA binding protein